MIQNSAQPACSKEYTVNLQGINAFTSIVVNQGTLVDCHNTPVKFGLNIDQPSGTSVKWYFGDGATNSLINTQRVYSISDANYTVSCEITNQFGCTKTLTAVPQVYIPKECFYGDVVATPANATVCKDASVTLTYVPYNDECSVVNYKWMNGFNEVPDAANADSIEVTSPGSYWVQVTSEKNCVYNSPTKITPTFTPLPNVQIQGQPSYCENDPIIFTAATNAETIVWSLDGQVYPQYNNQKVTDWSGNFSTSNFTVTCTVSTGGCTSSASHAFTVEPPIQDIAISIAVSCTPPYQVTISANAILNSTEPIYYNWSTGDAGWSDETYGPLGNVITVNEGGSFAVTASSGGGCSFTKQIDVPKSPENYIWIFPTGCLEDCTRKDFYLIGPRLPLNYWSWNSNEVPVISGSDFASPFVLENDSNYSLTINTGECDLTSGTLNFSKLECVKCGLGPFEIVDVQEGETPYCSFVYSLIITSSEPLPFQASISDVDANTIHVESSFTLYPGPNVIQFNVIPQNDFVGGLTKWRINGLLDQGLDYENCTIEFAVEIPFCNQNPYDARGINTPPSVANAEFKSCAVYPNPASGTVQVQYDLGVSNATIDLYDITGRLLNQKALTDAQGTTVFDINNYSAGMYIVVIRNENHILYQQKLIIK